jgi:hypothetical protein
MREFLANMMMGVKNGELSNDAASRITKLAGQINESFYAEVKVARTRVEAGEQAAKLGELVVGRQDELP